MKRFSIFVAALLLPAFVHAQAVSYLGALSGGTPAVTTSTSQLCIPNTGGNYGMVSGPFTASATGIVSNVIVTTQNYNSGTNSGISAAIYADSSGTPGSLLTQTACELLAYSATSAPVYPITCPMQSLATVNSGTKYWIALQGTGWARYPYMAMSGGTTYTCTLPNAGSGLFPSPIGTLSNPNVSDGPMTTGAGYVLYATATVLSYSASNSQVASGQSYLGATGLSATGTYTGPPPGGVLAPSYSTYSGMAGLASWSGTGTATLPQYAYVATNNGSYGPSGNAVTPTLVVSPTDSLTAIGNNRGGTVIVPPAGDVLSGVQSGFWQTGSILNSPSGSLALPATSNVLSGVVYGVSGTGSTGTASSGTPVTISGGTLSGVTAYALTGGTNQFTLSGGTASATLISPSGSITPGVLKYGTSADIGGTIINGTAPVPGPGN